MENMKCQVLINSPEKLANIIDSFHYTESTYNWPLGSLLLNELKLKVRKFWNHFFYLFIFCWWFFPADWIFLFILCVFKDNVWSAHSDGEKCQEHIKHLLVYSFICANIKGLFVCVCLFFIYYFTWIFLTAKHRTERRRDNIIGLKSGELLPFMFPCKHA